MATVATLLLLMPLLGSLVCSPRRYMSEKQVGVVGTASSPQLRVAVITFFMLIHHSSREVTATSSRGSRSDAARAGAMLVDPLSITMCLFVTGISALIHLYSTGYMHGRGLSEVLPLPEPLVFSMLLLVLANNLVLTFVGWEGVGLCSYWLVSYYFDRDSAASAGKKRSSTTAWATSGC